MAGVGEDDVRAVPQQEPVGELLVDDADIAGDDDGPAGQPECGEPVQHGLDRATDEGEYDHVVLLVLHRPQELVPGHLAQLVGAHTDLGELAGRGGGPAAQQKAAQLDGVRGIDGAGRIR